MMIIAHLGVEANPIDLLFGGMEKLGPGSNSDTMKEKVQL
jgi:hypothetical protein